MFIKDVSSPVLNCEFDRIFNLIDDSKKFSRFRKFIESRGLKYKSYMNRLFDIRLFNTFYNKLTIFGKVIIDDSNITIEELNNEDSEKFEEILSTLLNFEEKIQKPDQAMSKKFIEMIRETYEDFLEREEIAELNRKKFGDSVNDQLISLGASIDEQNAYWKNITDKKLLSPHLFIVYLKLINKLNLDREIILKLSTELKNHNDLFEHGMKFLPENIELCKGVLKSYIETR